VLKSDAGSLANGFDLPWYPIICDLCAGDPACVKICPTGAIVMDERSVLK
jgi:Fe-S-cluster-containing hydrogenase component 2